jgi:AhpD family alkylhydroperoxidase
MTEIRHLQPVSPATATGLVAEVYSQARREFGLLPPIPLHSPVPRLLAGAWCVLRETLVTGQVERPVKEALAAAISRLNRCPYCIDAHTLMLAAAGERDAARALAAGKPDLLRDEALREVVAWGAAHRSPGAAPLLRPPFPAADTSEMIGTAMAFHYINRMAHVFLPESPYPLPPAARWAKGWVRKLVAGRYTALVSARRAPGESLTLLEPAELPADLPWARGNPNVAGAFARFAVTVEEAVQDALHERVRERVLERLEAWDGTDPGLGGLGQEELDAALGGIPGEERAAGRLALLTAFASYRVDGDVVAAYRARRPADSQLLGAVSWVSYVAARRVGRWLWEALPASHRGHLSQAGSSR